MKKHNTFAKLWTQNTVLTLEMYSGLVSFGQCGAGKCFFDKGAAQANMLVYSVLCEQCSAL